MSHSDFYVFNPDLLVRINYNIVSSSFWNILRHTKYKYIGLSVIVFYEASFLVNVRIFFFL